MNAEQISEIEARANAATPTGGLWHICDDGSVREWSSVVCSMCRQHVDDSRHFTAGDYKQAAQILISALRAAQARVAALESAARIDIDAANAECAARDCKSWISRGGPCDQCPCDAVSVVAGAMGIESAAAQKIADAGQVTP